MKGYIYSEQMSLYGEREIVGFGGNNFYIKEIERNLANKIIIDNHYSKKVFNNSYIHLGCFIDNQMLGVLQFGHLLNNLSIGNLVRGTDTGEALELNRMWLSDKAERNSESKALSYCIKYIRGKEKKVKWIQSFADERCGGFGIVYQAANFSYYGEHNSIFYEIDGAMYHNIIMTAKRDKAGNKGEKLQGKKADGIKHTLRQFRYIYFIDSRKKKDCLLKEKPYPKHYKK